MLPLRRYALAMLPLLLACHPTPEDTAATPQWEVLASGLPGALLSVPARSHEHLYLLGSDAGGTPMGFYLEGDAWWELPDPGAGDLWWGFEWGERLWVVGDGGRVVSLQSNLLVDETVLDAGTILFGIWGTSPDDLYAVGSDGSPRMWHRDAVDWAEVALPAEVADHTALFKIWGRSAEEVWAVGDGGLALRLVEGRWRVTPTPTSESLFTLHGNSAQLYAVGGSSSGVILRWEDGWVDESPDGAAQLNGVYVRSQGCDPLAVGLYGAVWWRRDGRWQPDPEPTNTTLGLHAAWLGPYCDPWVVGGALSSWPMTEGVLLHRGGSSPPVLSAAPLPEGEVTEEASIITLTRSECGEEGWVTEVEIAGIADGARLTVRDGETGEAHDLALTRIHPQGYWSRWQSILDIVPAEDQVSSVSTRFGCEESLTWTVERLNAGGEPTDCLSWGADPDDC
jgi:hypothetical protein